MITKSTGKLKGNGPANQNDRMGELIEEEFENFKLLNPDLPEQKTTNKDLTFYWNLIRSNNMKVSKVYACQTNYISEDTTWNGGNSFMKLIILQYIEYRCAKPNGVEGDELDATQRAIKTAQLIIGFKPNGTNNDVKIDTMSNLSCVPAIILLNRALHHYGLKMINFHPEKAKDELLSLHQRALMSQQIRLLIPEPKKDELEKLFAKQNRKRIGYTRTQVLNTTHEPGRQAADEYINWYNLNKFDHLSVITGVRKTEVTDTTTVPKIGLKYPELRRTPVLPVDEGSEP